MHFGFALDSSDIDLHGFFQAFFYHRYTVVGTQSSIKF